MNPKKRKLKNRDDLDCRKKKRRKLEKELFDQNLDYSDPIEVKGYLKKMKKLTEMETERIKEGIKMLKVLKSGMDNKKTEKPFKNLIKDLVVRAGKGVFDPYEEIKMFDVPEIPCLKEIIEYHIQVYRFNKNVRKANELKRIVGYNDILQT